MCGICSLQIHLRQILDSGSRPAPQRLSSYDPDPRIMEELVDIICEQVLEARSDADSSEDTELYGS